MPIDIVIISAVFVGAARVAALAALVWGAGASASSAGAAEAAPADTLSMAPRATPRNPYSAPVGKNYFLLRE